MRNAVLQAADLNQMRRELYGRSASLVFYSVTPAQGEQQIATLTSGWHAWRKSGRGDQVVSGAVTIALARSAQIEIDAIRKSATADLIINSQIKRYRVVEVTETQQLGAGWIIHCEPLAKTV